MVAMLVKLYDDKRKCGLSKVRLDGGDFMIEKGFEEDFHLRNVLEKMRLIAARKLVLMQFDEYIDIMKHELSGQVSEYEDRFIIGKTLRCPMSIEEINKGIEYINATKEGFCERNNFFTPDGIKCYKCNDEHGNNNQTLFSKNMPKI